MAAQFERTFTQNLQERLKINYCPDIVFSNDNLSNVIHVNLFNGSDAYSGGGSVSATCILADGSTVPITNGAIAGNVVTVSLIQACLAVPGQIQVFIKLTSGSVTTTVFAGVFSAMRTATDTVIDPGTVITSIDTLINRINTAIDSVPADYTQVINAIAESYSTSKTYPIGAYVWYPGTSTDPGALYRCTTAITTAESWNAAHWTAAVFGNDIASLKSALNNDENIILPNIDEPHVGTIVSGGLNSDGTDQTSAEPRRCKTGYIKVDSSKLYYIGIDSTIASALYFYDENKSFISNAPTWQYGNRLIVFGSNTVEAGLGYVRILFRNSANSSFLLNNSDVIFRTWADSFKDKIDNHIKNENYFDNDVIGAANVISYAKLDAMSDDGTKEYPSTVRAITSIMRIDASENATVSAYVNGETAQALAIYYAAEDGAQISRGSFSSSPFVLYAPNAKYFRIYVRKDGANTAFLEDDVIEVKITRSKTIVEKIYDMQIEAYYQKNKNATVQTKQGTFDGDGIESTGTTRLISGQYIPIQYGQSAVINLVGNGNSLKYDYIAVFYSVNDYQTAQISRQSTWTETKGVITITDTNVKYFRLYLKNESGTTIVPSDVNVTVKIIDTSVVFSVYSPAALQSVYEYFGTRKYGQDIAVYNGNIFDFDIGKVSINGGADIAITNGHGNNCCFGEELHGDYPYLYCAAWNKNESYIYVNQYSNGAFTLVKTITYSGLTGYLNACVDEANNRAYIFLNTSDSTYDGVVDFVVGDLDGNVISRKNIDNIPVIEGITFYNGSIIVSSGHGINYPSYIHVFDTDGNLLSKTAPMHTIWDTSTWTDTIEGIDIDKATGKLYLGLTRYVFSN